MKAIAHPTDFSPASVAAFEHALRLAVEFRAGLDMLHVKAPASPSGWDEFPHVRETLERWRLLPERAERADIERTLGIAVRKVEIGDRAAEHGVAGFLARHRPDLVVLASHGAAGIEGLAGSVSEAIARQTHLPTLFLRQGARPFVDGATGTLRLRSILFGVAAEPSPQGAVATLGRLIGRHAAATRFVHVGERPMKIAGFDGAPLTVEATPGPVVETLLAEAERHDADLLVLATEGRHDFLDALRGSTTERVLHRAHCPVLALPA